MEQGGGDASPSQGNPPGDLGPLPRGSKACWGSRRVAGLYVGVDDYQQKGCAALWSLAAGNADNQAKIAAAGGIDAVVGAMGAHGGVAGVQALGCAALRNLAAGNADNKAKIAAAGGIDAVVGAMGAHRGVADVQKEGCAALLNLAEANESRLNACLSAY